MGVGVVSVRGILLASEGYEPSSTLYDGLGSGLWGFNLGASRYRFRNTNNGLETNSPKDWILGFARLG
ncbi:MAG: hypothetical protein ACI8TQ_002604 [Planctomycetota bacterium]|jgi:hypothetical protein